MIVTKNTNQTIKVTTTRKDNHDDDVDDGDDGVVDAASATVIIIMVFESSKRRKRGGFKLFFTTAYETFCQYEKKGHKNSFHLLLFFMDHPLSSSPTLTTNQ